MASIFSRIVQGEIPCHKIAETDDYFAFLDINPLQKGHTLVIPKREVDYIYDLEPKEIAGLHIFAQTIAKAIKKTIKCNRIGITVIGLEVPHAHIHLMPINSLEDMTFTNQKLTLDQAEMEDIAASIRSNYSN